MISSFGVGDPWDLAASKQYSYPVMWVTPLPSMVSESLLELRVAIVFGDLLKQDGSNVVEVYSDQLQNATDFVAWLQADHESMDIGLTSSLTPFTESGDESITGWTLECTVRLPFYANNCELPIQ